MSSTLLPPIAAPASVMGGLLVELSDVTDRIAAQAAAGAVTAVRGPALVELTAGLWACADRVNAAATHATGELHSCGELRSAGFISTKQWLMNVVGLAERDAKMVVARSASMVTEFAATWQAWNAGAVSGAAAREITMGIVSVFRGQSVSVRDVEVPVAESILLEVAKVGTVKDVLRMVETLRAAVNADGMSASALAAYDDQSFSCAVVGSMVSVNGHLSPESHALLATALEQIIDGWYRSGSLSAKDQPTGDVDRDRRARSLRRPHLWALALVELARRQLDNGALGSRHEIAPHLHLVVDIDRHQAGLPSELRVPGQNGPSGLGPDTIRRIMCDAAITPIAVTSNATGSTVSSTGTELTDWLRHAARSVLYVGREKRTVTRPLRLALEVRDQHCAFPDCHVDPSRCEAHHVQHWQHGGDTSLANMTLLCSRHHHLVHEGRWQITPRPGHDPGHPDHWQFDPPPPREPDRCPCLDM